MSGGDKHQLGEQEEADLLSAREVISYHHKVPPDQTAVCTGLDSKPKYPNRMARTEGDRRRGAWAKQAGRLQRQRPASS